MTDNNRVKTIRLIEKNNMSGLNEMYIHNNNGLLELDENLINLDIVNYKITNHLYQCRVNLANEYNKNGFNVLPEIRKNYSDVLLSNSKAKISFKDLFTEYANLRNKVFYYYPVGNESDRIRLIEREKPLIKEAYEKLGIDKVKAMNYHVGNIKKALLNMQTDISMDTKIVRCLRDAGMKAGATGTVQDVKNILQVIYKSLEIKKSCGKIKTAKTTDLDKWYEIKRTSPKVNGKTIDCISIIKEKLIYV